MTQEAIITAEDVVVFRAQAQVAMQDTCRIAVPGAGVSGDFNETSGQYDDVPAEVDVYGPSIAPHFGACRFQIKADINSNIVETTAGEREWTYATSQLQLPVDDTPDVPVDAKVYALTSRHNPQLPSRVFNVHGEIGHKSMPVIRRIRIREVTA